MNKILFILTLFISILMAENNNTEIRLAPSELEHVKKGTVSLIDALSIKVGPSFAITSKTDDNGGVAGVKLPDEKGAEVGLRIVFNNGYVPYFKPYADFTTILYGDRNFYIPSIGLRHDFILEKRWIEPYASLGVGYALLDRTKSPLEDGVSFDDQTGSANLTLEGGVDFYITKHIALDLSLRYDTYNVKTTIGGNFALTTINDKSSIALMGGLVYRFGQKKRGDDDLDGVINTKDYCPNTPSGAIVDGYGCAKDEDKDSVIDMFDECASTLAGAPVDKKGCALDSDDDGEIDLIDQCPNTLKGVPVNEAGCPPYMFEFSLTYKFNKKTIKNLLDHPTFDIIGFLNKHDNYDVRITGYADSRGNNKANDKISKQRAIAARYYLLLHGIDKDRITFYSRGKREGLFDNRTKESRRKNRKIVVELYRIDNNAAIVKDKEHKAKVN